MEGKMDLLAVVAKTGTVAVKKIKMGFSPLAQSHISPKANIYKEVLEAARDKFTREISFQSKDKDISLAKVSEDPLTVKVDHLKEKPNPKLIETIQILHEPFSLRIVSMNRILSRILHELIETIQILHEDIFRDKKAKVS